MKRIAAFLLSIALLASIFAFSPTTGAAASDATTVRVKLSIGNVESLNITLDGNYMLMGSAGNVVAGLSRKQYTVSKTSDSTVGLYDGGTLIYNDTLFTIVQNPQNIADVSVAKVYNSKYAKTISYLGDMEFRVVSSGGKRVLALVNKVYIEEYLYGVLPYEMANSWPMEALKAQAVCARIYAVQEMTTNSYYDVVDTSADQVYRGYDPTLTNCIAAVNATAKNILVYNGSMIEAYYSASNGGMTESPNNVWSYGNPPGYAIVRRDEYDLRNPSSMTESFSLPKYGVNQNSNAIYWIKNKILPQMQGYYYVSPSGSIEPIVMTEQINILQTVSATPIYGYKDGRDHRHFANAVCDHISGVNLTFLVDTYMAVSNPDGTFYYSPTQVQVSVSVSTDELFSYGAFSKSAASAYWLTETADSFVITHNRYGHGVGLSQRGAQQMAKEGLSYQQILDFYFPGAQLLAAPNIGDKPNNPGANVTPGPSPTFDPNATPTPGVTNPPALTYSRGEVINVNTAVNLRQGPGTSYAKAGTAPKGTILNVTHAFYTPEWHQVSVNGATAYIFKDYLRLIADSPTVSPGVSPTPSASPGFPGHVVPYNMGEVINVKKAVNLRQGPGTSYAKAGSAGAGAKMPVSKAYYSADWHEVLIRGQKAYVHKDYLRLYTDESLITPSPSPGITPGVTPTPTLTPTPTQTAAPQAQYVQVVNVNTSVNIRSAPDSGSRLLGNAALGSRWPLLKQLYAPNWHQINFNGQVAYIHKSYAAIVSMGTSSPSQTPSPSPTPSQSPATLVGTVTGGTVNVRQGPGTSYAVLGVVRKGDKLTITSTDQATGWYQFAYNGRYGYISPKYVSVSLSGGSGGAVNPGGSGSNNGSTQTSVKGTVTSSTLNVRSGPGTNYSIIYTLGKNATVDVTKKYYSSSWHQVSINGKTGYVHADYISFGSGSTGSTGSGGGTGAVGTVTGGTVNVRSGPGTSYKALGVVRMGDKLSIVKRDPASGWYQFVFNGGYAYISPKYVKI